MGNTFSRLAPTALLEAFKVSAPEVSRIRSRMSAHDETALPKSVFDSMLTLELQRAERSRKPFVLMLLDAHREKSAAGYLRQVVDVVLDTKRETDLVGWYREGATLGVIFTEVNMDASRSVTDTLHSKVEMALIERLGAVKVAKISFSLHVFPESQEYGDSEVTARHQAAS